MNKEKNYVTEERKHELEVMLKNMPLDDIEEEVDSLISKTDIAMTFMNILSVFVSASVIGMPLSLVVMIWYGASIGFKMLVTCLGIYMALSIAIGFLDRYAEMNKSILIAIAEIIDEMTPDDVNIIENENY